MLDAFVLELPAEPEFRALVPVLAGRYVELAGGSDVDRDRWAAAIEQAIAGMAPAPDARVTARVLTGADGVEIHLECGGTSVVLTHPLPAGAK